MQKVSSLLMLTLLALSILPIVAIPASAVSVPYPGIVEWVDNPLTPEIEGKVVHDSLRCDPEWLKVWTITHVSHNTTIIVQGKDAYGEDIEAKAFIPVCTPPQASFPLIDVHSGEPVTFSMITAVFQQGGEHCNSFQIQTMPEPYEEWLGTYHKGTGYEPNYDKDGYPVEPSNPDPLKVAINWVDKNGDGVPTDDECTPPGTPSTITIIGLDQYGNVLSAQVYIPPDAKIVPVDVDCHTWSTVCTVTGGKMGISYYIFTHPKPQRSIFNYKIAINRIKVTADPKNILADGTSTSTITITLLDIDGNEVHWTTTSTKPIEINVMSTGGKVVPSLGIKIQGCETSASTTLISDTNARDVKVSVLAMVPAVNDHSEMWLTGSDLVCFDGINSVQAPYSKVELIGGTGSGYYYKAVIKLEKGCNLISIPFTPEEELYWDDLPCAGQCLESVAMFDIGNPFDPYDGDWLTGEWKDGEYIGDLIPIVDGIGYWVKAKKPCTLVISGIFMDQAPFTPPVYQMGIGWNLIGIRSISGPIKTEDYLESLNIEQGIKLWGPVWTYRWGMWIRDPEYIWATEALWVFSYDGLLAP